MRTKEISVAGKLIVEEKEYWLIDPHPIEGDSWERDNMMRFLVVPMISQLEERRYNQDDDKFIYPFPRHLIINSNSKFLIEYGITYKPAVSILVEDLD